MHKVRKEIGYWGSFGYFIILPGMILMNILLSGALPLVCWAQSETAMVIKSITPTKGYTNATTLVSIQGENLTKEAAISIYQEDSLPRRECRISGWAQGVYAQGNYVYVADDTVGLQIIDVSQPDRPLVVGSYDTPGWACGVQVQGNYAYIADGYCGLAIIDVSQPDQPLMVGSYDTSGYAYGVFVRGSYAYVADDRCGLQIIDISQPDRPTLKGSCDTAGSAHSVYVASDYAYVADGACGLAIINVSQPAKPALVGSYDTSGNALSVSVAGTLAYVADGGFGLQIVDISRPTKPFLIGSYQSGSGLTCGVQAREGMAFLADSSFGLQVIDVTYPARPTLKARCRTPGSPYGIFILGNQAYVADGGFGVQMINISHINSSTLPKNYDTPGWTYGVFVLNGYAYLADGDAGLQIVGFNTSGQPTQIATLDMPGRVQGVWAADKFLYLAEGDAGLAIIDVSQPAKPELKGTCDSPGQANKVVVANNHAYVADGDSGLTIINVQNPSQPALIGRCDTLGTAYGVRVCGGLAYVADGDSGLTILDVQNPSQPALVGRCDTPGTAHGVFISGQYAYVADGACGLAIIDVQNPSQPTLAGNLDTTGYAEEVFVLEGYVYVADKAGGLMIVDAKNPNQPLPVAHLGQNLTGEPIGLWIDQNRLYLASGEFGLQVLSLPIFWPSQIKGANAEGTLAQAIIPAGLAEGFYTIRMIDKSTLNTSWLTNSFEVMSDNPLIRILYPQAGEIFKQMIRIQWMADQGSFSSEAVSIDIDYSPDRGQSWKSIATGEKNDGLYEWDTSRVADGDDYLIRITCRAWDQGERKIISQAVSEFPFSIANGNSRPQVLDVAAQQQADGTVLIHYRCLDNEQSSVNISFQYWDGSGWHSCSSVSGTGVQPTGQLLSASWRAREDVAGRYYQNCWIKVIADDGQAIDHLAEGQSQTFALDTAPPKSLATPAGGVYSQKIAVTLTASDDSKVVAIYYTTDGSNPTVRSPRFSAAEPIVIDKTMILKFFAVDSFGNQEPVRVEQYRMSKKVVIQTPDFAWPGTSLSISCVVQNPDGSLAAGEAVKFTLSVDGSAVFSPNPSVGKLLLMNSSGSRALVETEAGKVVLSLTDSRAEELHLVVKDTERMGLEIAAPESGLLVKFLDPDQDEDGDGLVNRLEALSGCLKVSSADSDEDGLPDGYEYSRPCLDPCDAGLGNPSHGPYGDPDGDGIKNLFEYRNATDPCLKDTDGDGLADGLEWGPNAQKPLDSDNDGLIDALDYDSDNDGLSDGQEYFILKTDYTRPDTDQDGVWDGFEVGPDPNNPAMCSSEQNKLCLCALDPGNKQTKPSVKSIRPGWSSDGVPILTIDGENLTASTLIGIFRDEPLGKVGSYRIAQGEALGVCTVGNYAYVAAGRSGLLVIDISQPENPALKGSCPLDEGAYGICLTTLLAKAEDGGVRSKNYAFVAAGYSGLVVIDLSQPEQPRVTGSCNTPGYARGVWVFGNMAYVADEWAGIQVIDISWPDKPVLKKSLPIPDWAYGVSGQGNYLYVAAGYSGLLAIDTSRPENPHLVASCDTPGYAEGVSIFEHCAYVADGYSKLQVIDLAQPGYPFLMAGMDLPEQLQVRGLCLSDKYLFCAAGSAGLVILSKPSYWSAQTSEVNSSGRQIKALLSSRIPDGSFMVKMVNPPFGEADPVNQTFGATTNSPPRVQIISARQQEGDGSVIITYSCLDQEQSLISISFQYWDGSRWRDCQAASGYSFPQPIGSNLTAIWQAKEEFSGQQLAACRIKIKADDGQAANGLAEAQSAPFLLDTKASTIIISPGGGTYSSPQTVVLSTDEPAILYYTTDGTDPDTESNIYTEPLHLANTTTLKVLAIDSFGNRGAVRSETYSILPAKPQGGQQSAASQPAQGAPAQGAAGVGSATDANPGPSGGSYPQVLVSSGYSSWMSGLTSGSWSQLPSLSPPAAYTFGSLAAFGGVYGALDLIGPLGGSWSYSGLSSFWPSVSGYGFSNSSYSWLTAGSYNLWNPWYYGGTSYGGAYYGESQYYYSGGYQGSGFSLGNYPSSTSWSSFGSAWPSAYNTAGGLSW